MWLGEQINEFGIGNGISMILFANIISSLPAGLGTMLGMGWWAILVAIVMVALVLFIIFVNDAERRIPVQYAKRVVGRKIYGGQSTNLPIKVSMSGVMPVIFAQSICSFPATICAFFGITAASGKWWYDVFFSNTSWIYAICYFAMIFFFGWFYAAIQYDSVEIANNLKKNGGFIPGFRPGKPTADFIQKVINKIVIFGSMYLGIVALLPIICGIVIPNSQGLSIGGTSVIIVIGVALETVKAIEAQMLMRHYKGFLD
jgi:preprotein translocase subunit SecY